ncbi:unnamed protein product [Pieris brassicae]|uniref:Uncharacterized protein n=1 Tax=Pieris brassicae TaxID=7116 RepID=A0A9P0XK90_PIEBR|nr:unnamed protein product [Pieris brassicae]
MVINSQKYPFLEYLNHWHIINVFIKKFLKSKVVCPRTVAPKDVYNTADEAEAERKRLEAAAPKKRRASSLLRAAQN